MTTTPGTLSIVIVVPTTGWAMISVRLHEAVLASHWLASTVTVIVAGALVRAVVSVAVKLKTTGAPGSAAGAAYVYTPSVAVGVSVPDAGVSTAKVNGLP